MVLDGGMQAVGFYESTNSRRFVTGLLFGCGLLNLCCLTTVYAFQWGIQIGTGLSSAS